MIGIPVTFATNKWAAKRMGHIKTNDNPVNVICGAESKVLYSAAWN
jgi:hypothetical protein